MTHREAKTNDVILYDLIVERAGIHVKDKVKRSQNDGTRQGEKARDAPKVSEKTAVKERASRPPPRDDCFVCKGLHRVAECTTATTEQKEEARRAWAARRTVRLKHIGTSRVSGHTATINGVLEVPFCADFGADSNVLSRSMVKELCAQDSSVVMAELKPPTVVKVAGGATLECRNSVEIDVRISTAAGTVLLTRVSCLVLDGDEDELLLGRSTLKDIGIDVDSC
ncbi:Aspartyl protease [Phytophthora infestans]|uniref:Aspartyl protease n=1 Tax=Phytophthora infestans TaxID=4787 RepID=A0A8S9UTN5_PHYIN|nr:Aspartyl protease [Phytophthora infestans]